MVFEVGPDPLLTCPLDESHRILKSRMQFHLVRCLKNNKLGMRLKCPWNPLHIIDKFAYENHYQRECEDMPGAMESIFTTEDRDVGSVPVTATNGVLPPAEEDWDAEPGPVGTYDPFKNSEGKPVLRIAIGLSKAKKKQYRQAERRRFQTLEENGPMQTNSRQPEVSKPAKELRPPLTISNNLSMIDDLNASKFSENNGNVRQDKKVPQELRAPHKPSLTLSYKADFPIGANGARPKNISSEDGARGYDEVPNLCQSLGNNYPDNMSIKSSVCSFDPIEMARKMHEKNRPIPNLNNSLASFSAAEKSSFLDDPTFIPNLIGPEAESEDNNVSGLSQRFAELLTSKKKVDNNDTYLMHQMGLYSSTAAGIPKLVSSTKSLNLLDRTHDDFPMTKQQNQFLNGITKCAANFPKLTNNAPQPAVGCGRGMVMAFDSFKDNKPGLAKEEINNGVDNNISYSSKVSTNPFEIPEAAAGENISHQTYTLTGNPDEDDSDYEKDD